MYACIRQISKSIKVIGVFTMTDLEKAQYAASVFANHGFKGANVWMVEENSTKYQVFGNVESPIDLDRISYKSKHSNVINVIGSFGFRYTVEEAYLIARSLERKD